MGNSMFKQREVYSQIMVRFPLEEASVKTDLEELAREMTDERGYYVSVNDLCKSALRTFLASYKRDHTMPETPFKLDINGRT